MLYHEFTGPNNSPIGLEDFWMEPYLSRFIKIIQQYKDIIKLTLTGHTHIEDYRVNSIGVGNAYGLSLYNNNFV